MARFRALRITLTLMVAFITILHALPPGVAFAATTITDCSSADAIETLLEGGGAFVFNCGSATITFDSQIDVRSDLSIDGGGTTTFTTAAMTPLFFMNRYVDFSVTGVTMRGGATAISNLEGVVTIANSTFQNNQTALSSLGGAVEIRNSVFSGNTAGALKAYSPYAFSITDSTFTGNTALYYGGALFVEGNGRTEFSISGGSFTSNHAPMRGGAIYIYNETINSELPNPQHIRATIDGVTFSDNSAVEEGGAIWGWEQHLIVRNSVFTSNSAAGGGALYARGQPAGWEPSTLSISTSTFTGNSSVYGGGVNVRGELSVDRSMFASNSGGALLLQDRKTASVTNSTFSGNGRAIRNGFGDWGHTLTINSSTFSNNGSEGAVVTVSGTTTIANSVIDAGPGGSACAGAVISGGHNIASDATCAFTGTGDRNSTATMLGPLALNGGPTQTHAPQAGSPAIDGGACPGLAVDQRGSSRPQGSACDVGAVEYSFSGPETGFANPPMVTGAAGGPFVLTSSEVGSTFECKLDDGEFSACVSPVSFPGLAEGVHTLQVQATDLHGRVDLTPASLTWSVDLTPPDTNVLGPGAFTNQNVVTFTFEGIDAHGIAKYRCRFIGESGWHDWKDCANPSTYTLVIPFFRIVSPAWQLYVAAVDKAGNIDPTPFLYSFLTDQWAPVTTIESTPPANATSSTATFTFSAFDNMPTGISLPTFECKLDSAAFVPCSTPQTYEGLADGQHTVVVRAVDAAGNIDANPPSYTWTVSSGPPDTTILTGPSGISRIASPKFTYSGGASYECRLDDASFAACDISASYVDLSDGEHTFQVRAIDSLGRIDPTPATRTWTIDTTAPTSTLLTQPAALSGSSSASFTFSASDATSVTFECKLDAAAFVACASPAELTMLSGGIHTFQVRAIDAAGNIDPSPASYTWTIDTTAPETTMLTTPPALSTSPSATFTFSGSDANGIATFECALDDAAFGACASPLALSGLSDGSHTLEVRAVDQAGNVDPTPASYTWIVDAASTITSADVTTFTVGTGGSFTIATTGQPAPALSLSGTLPDGISFDSASGVLSGTAADGTGGVYPLTITASNGVQADAIQAFTLTVYEAPSLTSVGAATFVTGVQGTFTFESEGYPTPSFSVAQQLPAGLSLSPAGVLSGTAEHGVSGTYLLLISATNGINPDATQAFTLTINEAPEITSTGAATVTVGVAGSIKVAASGYPAASFSIGEDLPAGTSFSADGLLSGTPQDGTGGVYALTITASNGVGSDATQAFTLTVNEAPQITSVNGVTFAVGDPDNRFQVTASGYPAPTFSASGTLPAGITLTPSGLLSGTTAVDGVYVVTITASNGSNPVATQTFTLSTVPPVIHPNEAIVVGNDPGLNGAVVSYPAPVTEGYVGEVTCTPAPGTLFEIGVTTVTCVSSTSAATATFTVTVNDTEPPLIVAPDDVAVYATGPSGAVVTYAAPTVGDNAPGVTWGCLPPSGSLFPLGVTTVTCTATDAAGNTAHDTFAVRVRVSVQACMFGGALSQASVLYGGNEPTLSCGGRGVAIVLADGSDYGACLFAGTLSQFDPAPKSCSRGQAVTLAAGTDYFGCVYAGTLSQVGASFPRNCGRGIPVGLARATMP